MKTMSFPRMLPFHAVTILCALCAFSSVSFAQEVGLVSEAKPEESPKPEKKPDSTLVHEEVLARATPENISVVITISSQRVHLKVGEEIAIDAPVSSGRRAGWTPKGGFVIVQKIVNHRSTLYGSFVSAEGRTIRSNANSRTDVPPAGASFYGAPMKWFMRLGSHLQDYTTFGMHAGKLPGYPASHGCIRLPERIAKLIFEKAKIGTPVMILE